MIHDWGVIDNVRVGVGGLANAYGLPSPLSASYGDPGGGMLFVRLKVQ